MFKNQIKTNIIKIYIFKWKNYLIIDTQRNSFSLSVRAIIIKSCIKFPQERTNKWKLKTDIPFVRRVQCLYNFLLLVAKIFKCCWKILPPFQKKYLTQINLLPKLDIYVCLKMNKIKKFQYFISFLDYYIFFVKNCSRLSNFQIRKTTQNY